ncbi:MAG: 30S ribosomal protein S9 [Candidatus Micrarchaeota archaeon]
MAEVEETKKKTVRKKKIKQLVARGKRKRAIARAIVKAGTGNVRVNGLFVTSISSPIVREVITEPLSFLEGASKFDISVNVRGGGMMGQAQAARAAIAKAIVAFTGDDALRKKMLEFDRSLLVDDARRVEPKKFKGPKARARFTKSYR